MTYRCPACKLLFSNMVVQCPQCRGPVTIDVEEAQRYLDCGYSQHGAATLARQNKEQKTVQQDAASSKPARKAAASDPAIRDEDLLESLRASYNRQHRTAPETGEPVPPAPRQPSASPAGQTQTSGAAHEAAEQEAPAAYTRPAAHSNRDPFAITEEPRVERHTEPYHRRRNGEGWFAFRNAMAGIRWGTVFRVLLIGGVIALGITAWTQRQQILDFFMSLVPGALIIGAIIWLLRKMIKG